MGKPFEITAKQLKAARLFADGLSQADVAEAMGIKLDMARRWYDQPLFKAEIEAFVEADREAIRKEGIANKQNRMDEYNRRWREMKALMRARAEWDVLADVPGGNTGLLCRDFKGVMPIYKVDAALLREMRELEKQAAIEIGDWTEKKELTGADGGAIPISIESAIAKAYGDTEQQTTKTD